MSGTKQNQGMKKTLLFALALAVIPVGVDAQVTPSDSCARINSETPLEDLRSCVEQGDAFAQSWLGNAYRTGNKLVGVPKDIAEAVRLKRLAAEQGYWPAKQDLGRMYRTGEGVPRDYVLAYMWYNLAAAQMPFVIAGTRDRLEEQMTREQIAEAQRLSTEWLEAHPPGGN